MASTASDLLKLELQTTGENDGTWGTKLNTALARLEEGVAGVTNVTITSGDYTLDDTQYAEHDDGSNTSESHVAVIKATGTLTAARALNVPARTKIYWVWNATGSNFNLTVQVTGGGGNGVVVPRNTAMALLSDGTDIVALTPAVASSNTASAISGDNLLDNPDFRIAQRGTAFTSATAPANSDDTYLLDRWVLLSDGNDIVDVNQKTDGVLGPYSYLEADVENTAKKFGFLQIIEQKNLGAISDESQVVSLSFKAKVSDAAKLDNIKAVVLAWSSTADSVTSDVVSAWNVADTTPTWATNWTAENTPANLSVTTSEDTYRIENIAIDTSGVNNLAVFIWSDAVADNDTAGTTLHLTDVKLEIGSVATPQRARHDIEEFLRCLKYCWQINKASSAGFITGFNPTATNARYPLQFPVTMRAAPSLTVSGVGDFQVRHGATNSDTTNLTLAGGDAQTAYLSATVASGLTAGQASALSGDGGGTRWIRFSADL